jgi:hypothetical protein
MCGAISPYLTFIRHIRLKQLWKVMELCPSKFIIAEVAKIFPFLFAN